MQLDKILVINGPNLNLLGTREKGIYGDLKLIQINELILEEAKLFHFNVDFYQSNIEGEIVTKIGDANFKYNFIIINPGAYSHYSIAILDALRSVSIPAYEVHLSNIYQREEYRKKSITAEGSRGVITGFGYYGYIMALHAIHNEIGGK